MSMLKPLMVVVLDTGLLYSVWVFVAFITDVLGSRFEYVFDNSVSCSLWPDPAPYSCADFCPSCLQSFLSYSSQCCFVLLGCKICEQERALLIHATEQERPLCLRSLLGRDAPSRCVLSRFKFGSAILKNDLVLSMSPPPIRRRRKRTRRYSEMSSENTMPW